MKHRLVAVTATIAALLGGSVVAAQPAAADDSPCTITGYSPRTVVLGLSPVTKRFGVSTSQCASVGDWSLDIDGTPSSGYDWLVFAFEGSPSVTLKPTFLSDRDAGYAWDAVASAYNGDFSQGTERTFADSFVLRRMTAISSFNAGPEPVVKGRAVTVKGLLRGASWERGAYVPLRYAAVRVQFKRAGTSTWRTVRTVKSSSTGWVSARITQNYSGTWRLSYGGSSRFGSRVTAGDVVAVR